MSFRRPCLDCGLPGEPGKSRCPRHELTQGRQKRTRRGSTAAADRLRYALNREGMGMCASCGRGFAAASLQVDHVVPLVEGGGDVPQNLQVLCRFCHAAKTRKENSERTA